MVIKVSFVVFFRVRGSFFFGEGGLEGVFGRWFSGFVIRFFGFFYVGLEGCFVLR